MTAGSGLTLIDLTLAGGLAQGSNGQDGPADGVNGTKGDDAYGGAIDSLGGDVVLDGVTFIGKQALGGRGGNGGIFTTAAGAGDGATGGAVFANQLDASSAVFSADSNLAQGGDGGNGASNGSGGQGAGGALVVDYAFLAGATLSNNRAQGGHAGDNFLSNPSMSGEMQSAARLTSPSPCWSTAACSMIRC
jgi:hypothetical protein